MKSCVTKISKLTTSVEKQRGCVAIFIFLFFYYFTLGMFKMRLLQLLRPLIKNTFTSRLTKG